MTDDKLDRALAFGESFNWVTPLADLYKDIANKYEVININRYCGWSYGQIKRLLHRSGINPWGREYTPNLISFRVKANDIPKAKHILKQNDIVN